ncbi:hypothetical protein CYMTET_53795 [Cymbomonas tetramitiformis]|uniref:Kinesin motor domain-containing protein n=1 Tax=Cymbomonas tetramitiformis TaxID=36881 RepID=A0AAE0BHP5_9CHLO|nr:hypothetical protein CYMTET_53795 [Cymbomonas tetramitiformis]
MIPITNKPRTSRKPEQGMGSKTTPCSPAPLQVVVRIRPPQSHDGGLCSSWVQHVDGATARAQGTKFKYDNVFGPEASQAAVYQASVAPLIDIILTGTSACIFAYGSTGAGKTYSMIGPGGGEKATGMMPLAAAELFRRTARLQQDAVGRSEFELRVSYVEVYCNRVRDLLAPREPRGEGLALREAEDGRVYAEGMTEIRVTSVQQLLRLERSGSKARSTEQTGVHAHSSRSHALLTIAVERRWRGDDSHVGSFHSQVAYLTLCDLAGSESMERAHDGAADDAGIATNLGLFHLCRVIKARAESAAVVPYRDSVLTRLLQTSLCGTAATCMLACVSPAEADAGPSLSTLRFAAVARRMQLTPTAARVVSVLDDDPMAGDVHDHDPQLQRRAMWIEPPGYNDVYARCVGDPADPLLLYVHGSGPTNSSLTWNDFALDIARRASPRTFYHVAIDCPGYGRSPGDRQTIRSYPGAFLEAVVRALGRRNVVAVIGSSQGCASAFNALLERPKLAYAVAGIHPVTFAPERFTALTQPALLIYNTEDPGHPVSVGRVIRSKQYLRQLSYFEFAPSRDGWWDEEHMGTELLEILSCHWKAIDKKQVGLQMEELPELGKVGGGLRAWCGGDENEQGSVENLRDRDIVQPMTAVSLLCADSNGEEQAQRLNDTSAKGGDGGNLWKTTLDPKTGMVTYVHVQTGRTSAVRPTGAHVMGDGHTGSLPAVDPLFEPVRGMDAYEDEEEKCARVAAEAAELKQSEASQERCDLCQKVLVEPYRFASCRCALCACCAEATAQCTHTCPVCGSAVKIRKGRIQTDCEELQQQAAARLERLAGSGDSEAEAQFELLQATRDKRKRHSMIVIEYGCTLSSTASAAKTSYTTYTRLMKGDVQWPIKSVDFNINPQYSKPTASVKQASNGIYAFEYAMGGRFPCVMTIHFKPELGLMPLEINFKVQDADTKRHIIMYLAKDNVAAGRQSGRRIGKAVVEFCARPPCSGWIDIKKDVPPMVGYFPPPKCGDDR